MDDKVSGGGRFRHAMFLGAVGALLTFAAVVVISAPAGARASELVFKDCITGDAGFGPAGSGACVASHPGLADPLSIALSVDGRSLYSVIGVSCST